MKRTYRWREAKGGGGIRWLRGGKGIGHSLDGRERERGHGLVPERRDITFCEDRK